MLAPDTGPESSEAWGLSPDRCSARRRGALWAGECGAPGEWRGGRCGYKVRGLGEGCSPRDGVRASPLRREAGRDQGFGAMNEPGSVAGPAGALRAGCLRGPWQQGGVGASRSPPGVPWPSLHEVCGSGKQRFCGVLGGSDVRARPDLGAT